MSIVSYKKYAELCELDVKSVYARIYAKKLKPTECPEPDGTTGLYIDTELYPPKRNKKGQGRKKL